jgi:hypothetical protein
MLGDREGLRVIASDAGGSRVMPGDREGLRVIAGNQGFSGFSSIWLLRSVA